MITASHNPEPDNGVKLVDPHGEMLEQKWEELATGLANSQWVFSASIIVIGKKLFYCNISILFRNENVEKILVDILETHKIDISSPASVYIGQDTR